MNYYAGDSRKRQFNNTSYKRPDTKNQDHLDLYDALMQRDYRAVKELMLKGVDPSEKISAGETALHYAARAGCGADVFQLLFSYGAADALAIKDRDNQMTALHYACEYGDVDVVRFLLKKGADANQESKLGGRPLHIVAKRGDIDMAKALIEFGADHDKALDKMERTPIFEAVRAGEHDMIEFLILQGANLDHQNISGQNVLHELVTEHRYDRQNIAGLLCHYGASAIQADNAGRTPLDHVQNVRQSKLYDVVYEAAMLQRQERYQDFRKNRPPYNGGNKGPGRY